MKPKIIITYKCNRSCDFCFQKDVSSDNSTMSYKDYCSFLIWLNKQNIKSFSILGGEPTLNPYFTEMVDLTNSMNFEFDLLTNLLFKNHLTKILGMNVTVCANMQPKSNYTKKEWELLNNNLSALASLRIEVVPSITIYEKNQGVGYIVEFAKKYDNIRTARIDLARPAIGRKNKYIPVNDIFDYKTELLSYISELEKMGLKVMFDCSFPKCFFTTIEIKQQTLLSKGLTYNECGNVIINPDLSLGSCPFYKMTIRKATDYESFDEIIKYAENRPEIENLMYETYLLERCKICEHRINRSCSSFCIAERA